MHVVTCWETYLDVAKTESQWQGYDNWYELGQYGGYPESMLAIYTWHNNKENPLSKFFGTFVP